MGTRTAPTVRTTASRPASRTAWVTSSSSCTTTRATSSSGSPRTRRAQSPYDLPLDARITVTFGDHGGREVALAVRNRERNEDEDGQPNLRDGKTNYFIFPGDTGADASWLMGSDFVSQVFVTIEADGKTFITQPFELRPHTHGAGDHEH